MLNAPVRLLYSLILGICYYFSMYHRQQRVSLYVLFYYDKVCSFLMNISKTEPLKYSPSPGFAINRELCNQVHLSLFYNYRGQTMANRILFILYNENMFQPSLVTRHFYLP